MDSCAIRIKRLLVAVAAVSTMTLHGAETGEKLYNTLGCYGCHGLNGEGIGTYPKLSGKSASYLQRQLHRLKKGIGQTSKRNLMIPFAKALSEAEIEALVHYLASRLEGRESEDTPDDILGGMGS